MTGVEQKADFRPDINALRALAVLAVVAYHYGLPGVGGGFAGVDVFFVISGYLIGFQIWSALRRGNFSFALFYQSRVRRIFPALAVLCLACLAWGWWYVLPYDYLKSTRHVMAALFFLSNLAFTGEQGYFDLAAHAKPLLHTWSLSVEGQFYVFLPLLMAAAWRWVPRHLPRLLALAGLLSLVWCLQGAATHSADAFYLLSARAWEFLLGVLLAVWQIRVQPVKWANAVALAGLATLLGSFAGLSGSAVWPGAWTLLPVLAAGALIAAGHAPLVQPLWRAWPLQRLGDVSYSLYLWHWPVWVFAGQYVEGRALSAVELWALATLSLVAAVLSWRFVEQPVRAKTGGWTVRRLWLGVAVVLLGTVAFGLWVVKTKGLPTRFPDYVQRASRAVFLNTPRDECFRRDDSTKDAAERFCHFGAAGEPRLLLWGDSHANQYLSAVSDAAQTVGQGGLIATQSGCRATLTGEPSGLPAATASACEHFNDEVNTLLAQTPSLQTVVLGRLWSADASLQRTLALVKQLVAAGKTVVLVGPLPEPGLDVPQAYAMLQIKAGQAMAQWLTPMAAQVAPLLMRDSLQRELADLVRAGRVQLLDPMARLCDTQVCRLAEDGEVNFRDTSHLSHTASLRFTPEFRAAFLALSTAASDQAQPAQQAARAQQPQQMQSGTPDHQRADGGQ